MEKVPTKELLTKEHKGMSPYRVFSKMFSLNFTIFYFRENEFANDFEAMLARKREDGPKRRKRRDIDIINDNDDIIDQLIQDMRMAAEVR